MNYALVAGGLAVAYFLYISMQEAYDENPCYGTGGKFTRPDGTFSCLN
jgi:hypothetical protein